MHSVRSSYKNRYSAKGMSKPINFVCPATEAKEASVIGDFNDWNPGAHPMERQPDQSWFVTIPLHHGHHHYVFLVDGEWMLDQNASGVARTEQNERVSLLAVS